MRVVRALIRRSLAQSGHLLALVAVSAVGAGSLLGLILVPATIVDDGVASLVADAEPTAGALRVDTALARDGAEAQDARLREAIGRAVDGAPLDTVRAVRSEPVDARVGGAPSRVVLGEQEGLADLAELVEGDWPRADDEATVAQPAAAALGLALGDTIELPGGAVRIVGIWSARDTADPTWFSETLVASGRSGDAAGPVMVADAALEALDARPRVSWTLVPRVDDLDAATLSALAPVEDRLRAATSDLASGTSYAVSVSGGLSSTVARATDAIAAARVLTGTAVVLALVAAGIVLALIARSIAQVRSGESELLTARGLSPLRATLMRLAEAAVAVGLGTALGVVGAVLIAAGAGADADPVTVAVTVAAGVVGVVLVATASRPPLPTARGRSIAETDSIVPALAVSALAGFAYVTAGAVPTSPVRYVVPALVLIAGVLLLRLLLAPVMRLAERIAARGPRLLPVLPLRQLGRRPRAVASAFVVVALAAGAVAVAGFAGGAVARDDAAQVRSAVGGEVRIRFTSVDTNPVTAAPYADLDGVRASTEVALVGVDAGSTPAPLVIAGEGFAAVTSTPPPPAESTLDVRVTAPLASRLGVVVGDEVPVSIPGVRRPLTAVVATIGEVPGVAGFGMLVARDPLAAVLPAESTALVIDEVWLAADRPDRTAVLVRAATERPATVLTPAGASARAVTGTGVSAADAAAAFVVLVGLGGLAASAAGLGRLRRGEALPLRALGVGAGPQARGRVVELLLTAAAGVVAGLAAGAFATSLAAVGPLSIADLAALRPLLLGALLAAGVLLVSLGAALTVRRDAGRRS